MTTFSFGGTSSSTVTGLAVRDVKRPLLPPRRDVYSEIPGRAGSWPFYEEYGDRLITVRCTFAVGTSSAVRTAAASLAAILDLSGKQQLIFSDQSDRFWYGRLDDYSVPDEQVGYAEFDLTFRVEPYAY